MDAIAAKTGAVSSANRDLARQRLQRFLSRFGKRFGAATWRDCPQTQSQDPSALEQFWRFFRRKRAAAKCLAGLMEVGFPVEAAVDAIELPGVLLLLELLLVRGEYWRCVDRAERLSIRYSADLRLQDIRARALILAKDDSQLASSLEFGWKPFAKYFCPSTFDTLAFFDREVYPCCVNYLPTSIGPITASSADELWDGEVAQSIRGAILDGSFRYCHKMVCPRLRMNDLPLRTEPTLSPYYKNIIAGNITSSPGCYPRSIELNEDPSCNLVCPSCRAGPEGRDTAILRRFESDVVPGILRNELNSFLVACYGEPFVSSHYLRVLRGLDPVKHPIKQLVLYTNGTRFTPGQWDELSNLHAYPNIEVRISVDAATAATYARIRPHVRGPGDFRALLANLEFASELRRTGSIKKFKLFFVIQYDNFREIPVFVQMGKWLGADEIVFSEMQKFGSYFRDDALYAMKAIHLATHPEHASYQAILADACLRDPAVSFHGCRLGLTPAGGESMNFVWSGDARARTMADCVAIPSDGEYHLVMALPLNKHTTRSDWMYTCQITFQQGNEGVYGAQFMMLVRRDSDRKSIMSPMKTGQVAHAPFAYYNATLCDTVQDSESMVAPTAGDYTFELYARSGGGDLTVIGTMTTIAVLEIPQPDCPPGGR